jgi:hypothetical protein
MGSQTNARAAAPRRVQAVRSGLVHPLPRTAPAQTRKVQTKPEWIRLGETGPRADQTGPL